MYTYYHSGYLLYSQNALGSFIRAGSGARDQLSMRSTEDVLRPSLRSIVWDWMGAGTVRLNGAGNQSKQNPAKDELDGAGTTFRRRIQVVP